MFIVVQIPLADLRPLVKGEMGRMATPDWTADDPGPAFVRGFGKVAARNAQAYGLIGERFFADFNNAVRLRKLFQYRQEGWPMALEADLWFRRLYFDGRMAGRFEFGFLVQDVDETTLAERLGGLSVDPRQLAAEVLAAPIGVSAPGCEEQLTTIADCGLLLCQAYAAATTGSAALSAFPPAETCGGAIALGPPQVQIRLANGVGAEVGRDRQDPEAGDGKLFVTSAAKTRSRNVLVCLSEGTSQAETAEERAVRVLFSHLHSLLFAQSHFVAVRQQLSLQDRQPLREALTDMVQRLGTFTQTAPASGNDEAFARAMQLFGQAHTKRVDALQVTLERILASANRPTPVAAIAGYADGLLKFAVEAMAKATVERGLKGGE